MERTGWRELESALNHLAEELSPRVEELATKSTAGTLSEDEAREYDDLIRINDLISTVVIEVTNMSSSRAAG